jgi:hypothetical protein
LALPDTRVTPEHYRRAAARALEDSNYTPREQQQRHAYYLQMAVQLEAELSQTGTAA